MKSMWPPKAVIFYMTYFHRAATESIVLYFYLMTVGNVQALGANQIAAISQKPYG